MYCSILLFCDNVTMEFSGQVSILESMGSEKLDMVFYLIQSTLVCIALLHKGLGALNGPQIATYL